MHFLVGIFAGILAALVACIAASIYAYIYGQIAVVVLWIGRFPQMWRYRMMWCVRVLSFAYLVGAMTVIVWRKLMGVE